MPSPWLRLACDFHGDAKILRAGPDASLVWPHVLALLKRKDGVASADDLDPFVMSRLCGGTVEQWTAGLDGLRRVGLLVDGTRRIHLGHGKFEERAGVGTPNWKRFQPEPRTASAFNAGRQKAPNVSERPQTSASGPAVQQPAGPVPSSPVGLSGSGKDINNNAPASNDDWNALDLYRRLGGRGMAIPSTGKVKGKPVMLSALMVAICNQNDGATIDDLVAESATKGNGLDWFLACFDPDTGKRKPKPQGRRRQSGPVPSADQPPARNGFDEWCNRTPDSRLAISNIGIDAAEADRDLTDDEARASIKALRPFFNVPDEHLDEAVAFVQRHRKAYD